MKLEAVIVCDNYSDFLAHTLPDNRILFDKIVVVTSFEDKETQRVCEFWHVQCIKTDVINSRKGEFCKGAPESTSALRRSTKTHGWSTWTPISRSRH